MGKPIRKKMKRATEREKRLMKEGKKIGFRVRELGRAFNLTHPAVSYILKNQAHTK